VGLFFSGTRGGGVTIFAGGGMNGVPACSLLGEWGAARGGEGGYVDFPGVGGG